MSHIPHPDPRLAPTDAPDPRVRVAAPSIWETPVSAALIGLNLLVFAAELALFLWAHPSEFGAVVFTVPTLSILATGGNYWAATLHEGRFETLLTSVFVHAGVLHIGFNMMALRQVGPFVERSVGAARMLPLYLLTGFVASFTSTFYNVFFRHADSAGVGASGAICGLIGAALVIGARVEGWSSPIMRAMARWLVLTVLIGFALPNIDNAAHISGAISGAIIALLWRRGITYSASKRAAITVVCAVVLALAFGRVLERDLHDPWALYTAGDRLAVAQLALREGDCATATSAAQAARRISASRELASASVEIAESCP